LSSRLVAEREIKRPLCLLSRGHHNDPQDVVRQWPLQRLGLVQRCAHPDIPLFIGGQDHGLTGNIPIL
jgi:hypothetical protein